VVADDRDRMLFDPDWIESFVNR